MKLRSLLLSADRMISGLLIILGLLQILATPAFFPRIHEPAVWFAAGGVLLALTGLLGHLRIRYGATAKDIVLTSIVANAIVAAMWIGMAGLMTYKFQRYPAAYCALALIVAAPVISVSRWLLTQK